MHEGVLGWNMADIKGVDPLICSYQGNAKPIRQIQHRLNFVMKEVVNAEVLKLIDLDVIYLVPYSKWVSPNKVPKRVW